MKWSLELGELGKSLGKTEFANSIIGLRQLVSEFTEAAVLHHPMVWAD